MAMQYYFKSADESLKSLESTKGGLTAGEAQKRLEKYGKNKLKEAKKESLIHRFLKQLADPMIIILILAAAISGMSEAVREIYGDLPFVYAGGVMSNRYLQGVLGKRQDTYFAEPQFSADNAAGVALLCRRSFLN